MKEMASIQNEIMYHPETMQLSSSLIIVWLIIPYDS